MRIGQARGKKNVAVVSEESFWLCAYLDERDEVVQCASSALVGRAYSALENSMLAFFEEAIWNS